LASCRMPLLGYSGWQISCAIAARIPVTLAASVGSLLPVATPQYAIIFASPTVSRRAVLRAGAPLDVIRIWVAVGLGALLCPVVLN